MAASQTPPPLRIAVVGGGIAGLSTVCALLKRQKAGANIDIKVYEAAPKFAEIGAGVAFGPNAQAGLKLIGVEDILLKVAGPGGNDPDTWFNYRIGLADHPKGKEKFCTISGPNAAKGSVHRADFLDLLIAQLPEGISHFNQRCTGYKPSADSITLSFTSQSTLATAEADIVIDASGIKSAIRETLYERKGWPVEEQKARYAEWIAWRGIIPIDTFRKTMGDVSDKQMICGVGRHILTFPIRGGDLINIVGFVRDDEHARLQGRTGPWSEPRPASEMLEDYKTFSEDCLDMLRSIENPSIWGIFELPPLRTHIDDRLVLIGDSAHATTPHQGSGAGQAVEDALFIAEILTEASVSKAPLDKRPEMVERALKAYQSARHERSQKVVKTSREAGLLYEMRGVGGEGSDTDKMAANLTQRMKWIWEYDLVEGLKQTVAQL